MLYLWHEKHEGDLVSPHQFKSIRLKLKLSQRALGELIFRHGRTVRYYESGERPIPPLVGEMMKKIKM